MEREKEGREGGRETGSLAVEVEAAAESSSSRQKAGRKHRQEQ